MTQSISAALHIQGAAIRYAEIAREDEALTLRRLGQRSFEFDVTRVLWGEAEEEDALAQVETAVQESLKGEEASSIRIVLHPLDGYSFFTPVPLGLSEREQRRYATHQAALVTGARSPDTLDLTLQSVRTAEVGGEAVEWIHVLAVPQAVAERMDALVDPLAPQATARMISSEAAARLVARAEALRSAETDGRYSLTVGVYASHTEYALIHQGTWVHAHVAQEAHTPADRAYYAVGALNRTGVPPGDIGRLFMYGPEAQPDADAFDTAFDCRPEVLDPFDLLPPMPERPQRQEAPGLSVPSIGGALAGLA